MYTHSTIRDVFADEVCELDRRDDLKKSGQGVTNRFQKRQRMTEGRNSRPEGELQLAHHNHLSFGKRWIHPHSLGGVSGFQKLNPKSLSPRPEVTAVSSVKNGTNFIARSTLDPE